MNVWNFVEWKFVCPGGPLFTQNPDTLQYEQIGIVSFGEVSKEHHSQ